MTNLMFQIERTEAWILSLVPCLVDLIVQENIGDELLVPALKMLANLCRFNPSVLTSLRHFSNHKVG